MDGTIGIHLKIDLVFLSVCSIIPYWCLGNVHYTVKNSSSHKVHVHPSVHVTAAAHDRNDFEVSQESRLVSFLKERYKKSGTLARPIHNSSESMSVDFGIALIQILDFDETNQVLTTNIWKRYRWKDQLLTWTPSDFGNVTDILLRAEDIWVPDIVLYNNADNTQMHHEEMIAVYHTGQTRWIPPAIYKSSCLIDMRDFPFDTQTCNFKFGSWMYDGNKLKLGFYDNISDIDMRNYIKSSEFEVLNTSAEHHIVFYPCCGDEPFPDITYYITIRRKAAFHIYVLILPSILLSFLTLVLFWIPPQRPDRTSLGMSLFSSFFVLLLILVQSAPPTSASISLLDGYHCVKQCVHSHLYYLERYYCVNSMYYCINMVLIALSTMLSAVVINLTHYMQKKRLPKAAKMLFVDVLGKLLCAQCADTTYPRYEMNIPERADNADKVNNSLMGEHYTRTASKKDSLKLDFYQAKSREWKILAAVIDRLFFLLYVTGMILSIIFVFPRGHS